MAQIIVNEFSSDYSYNVSASSYCTVALPITASWGPAFEDPTTTGKTLEAVKEASAFNHFPSTQAGLEAFISTYRGPAANWRSAKDYSYQLAVTLLTSGYDLDVCRMCPGTHAEASFTDGAEENPKTFTLKAKYPGTFGNNLVATLNKVPNRNYWNLITYVVDSAGASTAVENLVFVFDLDHSTDSIYHVSEVNSAFFDFVVNGVTSDSITFTQTRVTLVGGADRAADGTAEAMMTNAVALATQRFSLIASADSTDYLAALNRVKTAGPDVATASKIRYMEWVYTYTMYALDLLTDKLTYNPNRIILPGWDDQNFAELNGGTQVARISSISPLHAKLMEVAYLSRCATAFIDIPKSLERSGVYIDTTTTATEGYAQKISRYMPAVLANPDGLFATHSALFAPWGQYIYAGTSRQFDAPPSFLALLIQRAMILNQALQYEWAMPTTRKHNVNVGKLAYNVPKLMLDEWQSLEGVALNVITDIPDLGVSIWGNSTAYEVPPATYNALQNLSTRFLMNAIENVVYKVGLSITFQYNNADAYSKFYAGCSPILDSMKTLGAIVDYKMRMGADIDGLSSVNANTVIGKIWITVAGVINDIVVDLVALPASADLSNY